MAARWVWGAIVLICCAAVGAEIRESPCLPATEAFFRRKGLP